MKNSLFGLVLILACTASAGALAGPFSVNFTDGTATITGTITTDAFDDIVDFSLNVSGTGDPGIDLSPFMVAGFLDGGLDVSATEITFDTDFGFAAFNGSNGTVIELSGDFGGVLMSINGENGEYYESSFTPASSPFVIATVPSVPEPSSLLILGLGLTGLSLTQRRNRKAKVTA